MPLLSNDAFPMQPGVLEAEEYRDFQPRKTEVSDHLGDVAVIETRDDFRVGNDVSVHNQVRHERPNEFAAVIDVKSLVLLDAMPP
jgi:hypothetical protein